MLPPTPAPLPLPPTSSEFLDLFGPRVRHRTPLTNHDDDYCLIEAVFPPGARVRLHSHEHETFFVLSGEFQGFKDGRWHDLGAGSVFDVPAGVRHALRNVSDGDTHLLVAIKMRVGRFLRDIGRPTSEAKSAPPTAAETERITKVSAVYGYWRGTLEENAAIGLT